MPGLKYQDRALAWARSDPNAARIVRALASCPTVELGWYAELATGLGESFARSAALAAELEDLALGVPEGRRSRARDFRAARQRYGFHPACVAWGSVARAVMGTLPRGDAI